MQRVVLGGKHYVTRGVDQRGTTLHNPVREGVSAVLKWRVLEWRVLATCVRGCSRHFCLSLSLRSRAFMSLSLSLQCVSRPCSCTLTRRPLCLSCVSLFVVLLHGARYHARLPLSFPKCRPENSGRKQLLSSVFSKQRAMQFRHPRRNRTGDPAVPLLAGLVRRSGRLIFDEQAPQQQQKTLPKGSNIKILLGHAKHVADESKQNRRTHTAAVEQHRDPLPSELVKRETSEA